MVTLSPWVPANDWILERLQNAPRRVGGGLYSTVAYTLRACARAGAGPIHSMVQCSTELWPGLPIPAFCVLRGKAFQWPMGGLPSLSAILDLLMLTNEWS